MKLKTKIKLSHIATILIVILVITFFTLALIKDSAYDDYICAKLADGTVIEGLGRMIMYSDYAKFELDGRIYYLNSKDVTIIEDYADN